MASSGSGYDLNPTTFSPDGRLFQQEYTQKCILSSPTLLALHCTNGIAFCIEKPKMFKGMEVVDSSISRRSYMITPTVMMLTTGHHPDSRQISTRAREEAAGYKESYGEDITPQVLAARVASFVHYFTLNGSLRPFGCQIILASYNKEDEFLNKDEGGFSLYMIETSGVFYKYSACVSGKGRQSGKTEVEKLDLTTMTVVEGVANCARIVNLLYEEGKDKEFTLECGYVDKDGVKMFKGSEREAIESKGKEEGKGEDEDDDMEEA